ncbi:MAG: hypothetical protein V4519_00810 [Patescibacteria group bacterium]
MGAESMPLGSSKVEISQYDMDHARERVIALMSNGPMSGEHYETEPDGLPIEAPVINGPKHKERIGKMLNEGEPLTYDYTVSDVSTFHPGVTAAAGKVHIEVKRDESGTGLEYKFSLISNDPKTGELFTIENNLSFVDAGIIPENY